MGFLSSLVAKLTGRSSVPVAPAANPASPSTLAQRLLAPTEVKAALQGGGWTAVSSSNVAAIRWVPGHLVLSILDPANLAKAGPQGGAPILGDIRLDVGVGTGNVGAASTGPGTVTDTTLGTLMVRFRGKGKRGRQSQYEYYDVPRQVFHEFAMSASKGKFVWQRLRNFYKYRRTA